MQFYVLSDALNSFLNRAASVIPAKSYNPVISRVHITAEGNQLTGHASDCSNYLQVSAPAQVYEAGTFAVDAEDIALFSRIPSGHGVMITVDAGKITARSDSGKTITVSACLYDDFAEIPCNVSSSAEMCGTFPAAWIAETVKKLRKFTASGESNKMMQAVNFNFELGRVEALDGHRFTLRSFPDSVPSGSVHVMFPAAVADSVLSGIVEKNNSGSVTISRNEKFSVLSGDSWTLASRCEFSRYFDTARLFPAGYDFELTTESKVFAKVLKEYKDFCKKSKDAAVFPCILSRSGSGFAVSARNARAEMSDEISAAVVSGFAPENYRIGYNPGYMLDACQVSGSPDFSVQFGSAKQPIVFVSADFSGLILPANIASVPR